MKHLKTQKQLNEASENLNISDVSRSFSQDEVAKLIAYFTDEFLIKHDLYDKLKKTPALHSLAQHWLEERIKKNYD
jgi:hypothetical protein